jgi:hypothetical protein
MSPFLARRPTAQMAGLPPTQTPSSSTKKRTSPSTTNSATKLLLSQTMMPCSFDTWISPPRLPYNSTRHSTTTQMPSFLSMIEAYTTASNQLAGSLPALLAINLSKVAVPGPIGQKTTQWPVASLSLSTHVFFATAVTNYESRNSSATA